VFDHLFDTLQDVDELLPADDDEEEEKRPTSVQESLPDFVVIG